LTLSSAFNKEFFCAPLLTLAVILGLGSFWWQSSLYQGMLDRIDAELQLITGTLDYLEQTLKPEEQTTGLPCEWVMAPLQQLAGEWYFARYSPSGDLICFSTSGSHSQITVAGKLPTDKAAFFFTASQGETRRALLWPIRTADNIVAYQLLSADLTDFTAQLLRWRLALFLGSIFILVAAALYFLHPRRKQQTSDLQRLLRYIDGTSPDHPLQPFPTDQLSSVQLRRLAESCYNLNQRMFSALHRARQFAANVAHELRTPLTILRGETEIALRSKSATHDIRQVLESNLEEITRMSLLVDDLLTLSKSDLGQIPLQPEAIHLHQLLTDLNRQAQILAREKEILVEFHCPDVDIVIHADELRLRQALLNLLTNAIRYTPARGVITIAAATTETAATITISDTGIGIKDHHLKHIFERFYRVDKDFHQYDGGTGLGLAIVKWVVDAHHGTIAVSSNPESGSSFAMTLPRNRHSHAKEQP
jgi:signal transduction histidine kinase